MYSLTMARAHPYRGFFWQSVLISVVALAQHHSHCAPAGIRTMVCLHGTIPRTVSLSLYQCALPTTLAGLITTASYAMGSVLHNRRLDTEIRRVVLLAKLRPVLEYCSTVWHAATDALTEEPA